MLERCSILVVDYLREVSKIQPESIAGNEYTVTPLLPITYLLLITYQRLCESATRIQSEVTTCVKSVTYSLNPLQVTGIICRQRKAHATVDVSLACVSMLGS